MKQAETKAEDREETISESFFRDLKKQIIVMFGASLLAVIGMNYGFITSINRNIEQLVKSDDKQEAKIEELQKIVYSLQK